MIGSDALGLCCRGIGALVSGSLLWALSAGPASADEMLNETIVVRAILPESAHALAGSAARLDEEALRVMAPITVKEALRRTPGVNVIDEDGFGLKLNITVRGLNPRRSSRTLLLEDGMPIQPAPYADPSAHYYPPLGRVEKLEFLRGAGQVLHGPQSVGGMVNFVTRAAPRYPILQSAISVGEGAYADAQVRLGAGGTWGGVALDLERKQGDGIRDGHETILQDSALRLEWRPAPNHAITLRTTHTEEDTRLTEAGLDQARFDISPYYNAFENDRFDLTRSAAQGIHAWRINPSAVLSTQAYFARTERASYRQTDTSVDRMVENVATGCTGAARLDYESAAALCGNKMRPREFEFFGFEPKLSLQSEIFGWSAATTLGLRAHFEDTRRRRFDGLTPDARENSPGSRLRDENLIDVEAYALYGETSLSNGPWTVTPGLRVEDFTVRNEALRANFVSVSRVAEDRTTILAPGFGLTRALGDDLTLFAGLHSGFAPARPDRDLNPTAPLNHVKPERSVEFEGGIRARLASGARIDVTAFDMELDDLIVASQLVGGRSGAFENAGRARHAGIEIGANAAFGALDLSVSYAHLAIAEFLSNASETESGVRGARVPYAPKHSFDAALTYRGRDWTAQWGVNYISDQFADARNARAPSADGMSGLIPARTVHRAALTYRPSQAWFEFFVSADNIFDTAYISSRVDGLFAGPPRRVVAGLKMTPSHAPDAGQ